jgi:hypothetical protein
VDKFNAGAGFSPWDDTGAGLASVRPKGEGRRDGGRVEEQCLVMFIPIGAAMGALSCVTSLLESAASSIGKAAGSNPLSSLDQALTGGDAAGSQSQSQTTTGAGAGAPPFDSGMLATLIALQGQGGAGASGHSGMLSKLDTDGDGQISQKEFENAAGKAGVDTASADALFGKLDANGDGNISQSELASARHGHGHHHMHSGQGGLASLLKSTAANGSTTQTSTNADGSTTTTISYTDGSKVSMTTSAPEGGSSSGSSGAPSQNNLIEQLIRMQSQLAGQSTSATSTIA